MHVRAEHPGMDEFGSEDGRLAEVAARDRPAVGTDRSRDRRTVRVVTAVAAVQTLVLIGMGVWFSGVLRSPTGTIVVDSQPAAEVRIDGTVAGTTPLSVTAAEGPRSVEVRHQQTSRQWTIQVARGETSRSYVQFVTLALPRGSFAINAQPWADVWLNGEHLGETPLGNLSRPIGFYDVLLRHPDHGERRARLRVTSEGTARLNVDMRARVDAP